MERVFIPLGNGAKTEAFQLRSRRVGTFVFFLFSQETNRILGWIPREKEKICVVGKLSSERASQKEKKIWYFFSLSSIWEIKGILNSHNFTHSLSLSLKEVKAPSSNASFLLLLYIRTLLICHPPFAHLSLSLFFFLTSNNIFIHTLISIILTHSYVIILLSIINNLSSQTRRLYI